MNLPAFLNPLEIKQLTGKLKGQEQAKVLNKMGVSYKRRWDGEIIISRLHIEKILDGLPKESVRKESEPDYGAL